MFLASVQFLFNFVPLTEVHEGTQTTYSKMISRNPKQTMIKNIFRVVWRLGITQQMFY